MVSGVGPCDFQRRIAFGGAGGQESRVFWGGWVVNHATKTAAVCQEEKLSAATDQVAFAEAESTEILDSAVAMLEGDVTQAMWMGSGTK